MKKNNRFGKILFIFSFLIISNTVFSEDQQACQVFENKTHIYYGNGVNNTLAEANFSKNSLFYAYMIKNNIRNEFPEEEFKYFVAYNASRGAVKDIIEVINQKVDETGGLTASEILYLMKMSKKGALAAIKLLSTASGGGRIVVNLATKAVDVASDAYIKNLEDDANGVSRYYQQETTDNHIQKYNSDLSEGIRVIVVAHSQGNLFANEAVNSVITGNSDFEQNIGIVSVANPAGLVIGGNSYVTAHDDRVIDALRITHNVLASNIDNDPGFFDDPRDFLNHSFTTSYMASELTPEYTNGNTLLSRAKINGMFLGHIRSLEFPLAELGDGAIKVTLTWGSEPDVDLHVFEPNGKHVFYSNLRGTSGFLDQDDVSSFGPEHYFVACEDLEEGIYRVGVNYFSGSSPETARVQVTTADGRTQTIKKMLSNAVGSSGNNSPKPVMDIDVNRDEDGKYIYDVTVH